MSEKEIIVEADPEISDLLPGYLESRREDVARIETALACEDYDTVYAIGHRISGSAGGYGFYGLTEIAFMLVRSAKEKDEENVRNGVARLSDYLKRVRIQYD